MWRRRFPFNPLIQSLLKTKLQPSLESPWSHPFSMKTTCILTFKQKRVIQNQSQHITSLPLLSPTKTKTPKNIYCQAWSTNNYLLWLVSLLALKNDNTHSLHDKPLFFWDATSHTNKHNNTPHVASIESLANLKTPNPSIITKRHEMLETSDQAGCSTTGKIRSHFAF